MNYDRKQATFSAEPASYDEAAIIGALKEAGFGGSVTR
ncbi:MAG: hypothetical protein L0Y72_06995 [Gemmataceae bacterium]|nr:hypothetical protein [Gemmataceae bacterium]MCI0738772.1 hypothetical protein [Gemmataceae bacterium]